MEHSRLIGKHLAADGAVALRGERLSNDDLDAMVCIAHNILQGCDYKGSVQLQTLALCETVVELANRCHELTRQRGVG
jgi:hypothetical protein